MKKISEDSFELMWEFQWIQFERLDKVLITPRIAIIQSLREAFDTILPREWEESEIEYGSLFTRSALKEVKTLREKFDAILPREFEDSETEDGKFNQNNVESRNQSTTKIRSASGDQNDEFHSDIEELDIRLTNLLSYLTERKRQELLQSGADKTNGATTDSPVIAASQLTDEALCRESEQLREFLGQLDGARASLLKLQRIFRGGDARVKLRAVDLHKVNQKWREISAETGRWLSSIQLLFGRDVELRTVVEQIFATSNNLCRSLENAQFIEDASAELTVWEDKVFSWLAKVEMWRDQVDTLCVEVASRGGQRGASADMIGLRYRLSGLARTMARQLEVSQMVQRRTNVLLNSSKNNSESNDVDEGGSSESDFSEPTYYHNDPSNLSSGDRNPSFGSKSRGGSFTSRTSQAADNKRNNNSSSYTATSRLDDLSASMKHDLAVTELTAGSENSSFYNNLGGGGLDGSLIFSSAGEQMDLKQSPRVRDMSQTPPSQQHSSSTASSSATSMPLKSSSQSQSLSKHKPLTRPHSYRRTPSLTTEARTMVRQDNLHQQQTSSNNTQKQQPKMSPASLLIHRHSHRNTNMSAVAGGSSRASSGGGRPRSTEEASAARRADIVAHSCSVTESEMDRAICLTRNRLAQTHKYWLGVMYPFYFVFAPYDIIFLILIILLYLLRPGCLFNHSYLDLANNWPHLPPM